MIHYNWYTFLKKKIKNNHMIRERKTRSEEGITIARNANNLYPNSDYPLLSHDMITILIIHLQIKHSLSNNRHWYATKQIK